MPPYSPEPTNTAHDNIILVENLYFAVFLYAGFLGGEENIVETPDPKSKNYSMSEFRVYFLNEGGGYLISVKYFICIC